MYFFFLSELINFGEVENSERLLGELMSHLCATRREQPSYCFQLDQNWWSLREKMCNLWWNLWKILNVQFPLHKVENSCFKSNFWTFSQLYNPNWSKKHNYKLAFLMHHKKILFANLNISKKDVRYVLSKNPKIPLVSYLFENVI